MDLRGSVSFDTLGVGEIMVQILAILISINASWAGGQEDPVTACTNAVTKMFQRVKGPCTWAYMLPPDDTECYMSCNSDDQYIGQRFDPQTKSEKEAGIKNSGTYPMIIDHSACGAGPEAMAQDASKSLENEKKRQIDRCQMVKAHDPWHLEDFTPLKGYENGTYRPPPDQVPNTEYK
jgi:hypothetical protein